MTILSWLLLSIVLAGCGPSAVNPPKPDIMYRLTQKPDGDGPFPAIVILHGCAGIGRNHHAWLQRLNDWGYVGLIVDSFPPRNVSNKCASPNRGVGRYDDRVVDAYGAVIHLQKLPYVDPERIGLIGFSHGGGTSLRIMNASTPSRFRIGPEVRFKAAVAYYPYCEQFSEFYAPLMILIGGRDDWTPAGRCTSLLKHSRAGGGKVVIKVYPQATHSFDYQRPPRTYQGHPLEHHATSALDSFDLVEAFFEEYLQ